MVSDAGPVVAPGCGLDAESLVVNKCPICLGSVFSYLYKYSKIPIEICCGCGLVLQNPQPSDQQLLQIYGPNYFIGSADNPELLNQFSIVKQATARLQLNQLEAHLAKKGRSSDGLRLLEIGCGHGNLLLEARARGYHVHGIDYSDDAVAVTNQKLGFEAVRVAKTSVAEFPENSFDVCILADVIEHVRDPWSFLTQIWHMLDDQAVVFIATPNVECISARILRRHWVEFKQEHLFYFTGKTINRLLSQAGYVDIEIFRGQKVLTPAYIFAHFDKFPVPVLSSVMQVTRNCTPRKFHEMQIKISGNGLDIYASKPRSQ